jgi:DNA-binding response OmpR family regulator
VRSILAAEDDEAIRDVLVAALGDVAGWVVTAVSDGAKLLDTLISLTPDVILLDVGLPGISGLETYRLFREREASRDVPVLFITATPDEVKKARLSGPHTSLAKPFDLDTLLVRVAEMLGEPAPPQC